MTNPFEYVKPTEMSVEKIEYVREKARELHEVITNHIPASRERSLALTKLEEVSMWANKAIVFTQDQEAEKTSQVQIPPISLAEQAEGPTDKNSTEHTLFKEPVDNDSDYFAATLDVSIDVKKDDNKILLISTDEESQVVLEMTKEKAIEVSEKLYIFAYTADLGPEGVGYHPVVGDSPVLYPCETESGMVDYTRYVKAGMSNQEGCLKLKITTDFTSISLNVKPDSLYNIAKTLRDFSLQHGAARDMLE